MSKLNNIISFYKDCYAYDYRSVSIRNFFSRSSQHIMVVDNIGVLKDAKYQELIDPTWGRKAHKDLLLNSKEKAFYAGALFIMSKAQQLGRTIRVAPPLYIYEASLNESFGKYRISVDVDNQIINPYFLELAKILDPEVEISYEDFAQGLPTGTLGVAEIIQIETWLNKTLPKLDTSSLTKWYEEFGKVENARFIYKNNRPSDAGRLIAGTCLALIKKQEGSMGVLNELNTLAKSSLKKNSLSPLFTSKMQGKSPSNPGPSIDVPFLLSTKQQKVFENASSYKFSLVVGPPGTGKSYTVAALTAHLISLGRSVLVASKNSQAGNVVVEKLEKDGGLKGLVIKAGRKSYKYHLGNKIRDILSGIRSKNEITLQQLIGLENQIVSVKREIQFYQEQLLAREKEEYNWGTFYSNNKDNFFSRFRERWIKYQHSNARKIWDIKSAIDARSKKLIGLKKKVIRGRFEFNMTMALRKNRKDMLHFTKSLAAETGSETSSHFENANFENVLSAIPGWVIKTSDAHHVLPLEADLFDTLIIDEATQCDIASCLPLIYRAKNIVIIGDPKQLRHLSFLSVKREGLLNAKYGLESYRYRDYSILDLLTDRITDQDQITFLNEHFRSLPDIIAFSNKKFYSESLHLMTETPVTRMQKHLYLHHADGLKNRKGENIQEAEAIMKKLVGIIKNDQKIEKSLSSKVGIVSPFRGQVNLLKAMVKKRLSLDQIRKHEILIGSPYHFQGEERDVILLSMVVDKKSNAASNTYLNRPDVFNVSITRARNLQIVYASIKPEDLSQSLLLYDYLSHIEAPRSPKPIPEPLLDRDEFSDEVANTLHNWKVDQVYTSYALSGVIIDLLIVNQGRSFCVDLIGFPGPYKRMFDSAEVSMLNRMGHKVFFLPYSEWHLNRDASIESLHDFIFRN